MDHDQDPACPRCRQRLPELDSRFSVWCPACDWNVDPLADSGDSGRGGARTEERQERILRRVLSRGTRKAWSCPPLWAAFVLATAVNLVTVALTVAGVWLVAAGANWPQRLAGGLALVLALVLRPRPGKMPKHAVNRSAAPVLHALVDRVAAVTGIRRVDAIAVDQGYGSRCVRVGLRRRRVLVLGLPLWEVLTGDQRLALLGHDLGRSAGTGLSTAWIETALDGLSTWADVVRSSPEADKARMEALDSHLFDAGATAMGRQNSTANMGAALAAPLQDALAQGALLLHRLLNRLSEQSGGLTEYRADEAAARTASSDSAEQLLRALLLRETALAALARTARGTTDIWPQLRDAVTSVPDTERERRLRVSRRRDSGTPPVPLRLRHIRALNMERAAVDVSDEETRAIEAELEPTRALITAELRNAANC